MVTATQVVAPSEFEYRRVLVLDPSERRYSDPLAAVMDGAPEPKNTPKLAVDVANSAAEPPAVIAVPLIAVTVPVPETVVPVTAPVDVTDVNDPAALVVAPMTELSIVAPDNTGSENATPTDTLLGILCSHP